MSERKLTVCQIAERSINKTYRKELWSPFIKAIQDYELIKEGDHIAACISGGKDSMLMAKMLQQLSRISNVEFRVTYLVMNPGYSQENIAKIINNAKILGIPIVIKESDIFDVVDSLDKSPCYLCARMRRGTLYSKAKELGCNKIALGHHKTDVIVTTVLGMFYGAQIQGMMPKLWSSNFEGMELIRPMYDILEEDIIRWRNYNNLEFLQCACRLTENINKSGDGIGESKRQEIKALISSLKEKNPMIESNIFNSIHNVQLNTLIGYKYNGIEHSFLDEYYKKNN